MDMNRILVPVDGSKKSFEALDRALTLAGFTRGAVTAVHVIPHVPGGGARTRDFDRQLREDAEIILKKAEKRAGNRDVRFRTKILRGSPGYETVALARKGHFDHIVLSTTGSGSATGDMLGSVSNFVLHKSKVPVYLIK